MVRLAEVLLRVVGELEATEPVMVGRTPLRVWCVPGKRRLAAFGQRVGAASLAFFEDYYGLPYPGDKLDLLAIPDFAAGAMENLGCVTFREVLLLVEPSTATQPELQNVVDVIARELAHMWFGDLVTMKWWNGIWLNEAFATFMEMKVTDAFRPDWDRWTSFGISRSAALDTDALHSTRPIEFPVASPEEAEGMFDVLTYEKGAAVVRMLERGITPRMIMTRPAFENAIALTSALGGSTNAVLHLLAIAYEAGVELHLDDFNRIAARVPHIADMKPGGRFLAKDLHAVGGVEAVLKELLKRGALHGSCLTLSGSSLE